MNKKTQIDVLPGILSLRKWITLCILILISVSSKFHALSYNERIEGLGQNVIYVTKGTTIFIGDSNIKIKQVLISKENRKIKIRQNKKPKTVKSSDKREQIKTEQIKAAAILYSKNSSSGSDLSVPGRKDLFFIASTGETQIKSSLHRSVDVLYVQNYLYGTSIVSGSLDELFLEHHFSESHAIRPPPFII
ncbi:MULTISPECIES: hypothetical protein [Chryseobacterium]|uniref:hypothetical protein n=1 Tax=Chryseobacterium TaxID=59732 RepID=UPI001297C637|nr:MULTISPECIES: hypothetical protein [Chryseobacterium]MDR6921255.1 hypothetical protein [Chryseobacterium sp. 2987]